MKQFFLIFSYCLLACFFFTNCKKDKPKCGCNDDKINNVITDFDGELAYNQYNKKWYVFYLQSPSTYLSFYACNTNHPQLKNITEGADNNQTYLVRFSGKVKEPCPDESFGWVNLIVINNYIIIDSINLN